VADIKVVPVDAMGTIAPTEPTGGHKKNRLVRELDAGFADPITLRGGLICFFSFFLYKERENLF